MARCCGFFFACRAISWWTQGSAGSDPSAPRWLTSELILSRFLSECDASGVLMTPPVKWVQLWSKPFGGALPFRWVIPETLIMSCAGALAREQLAPLRFPVSRRGFQLDFYGSASVAIRPSSCDWQILC